MTEQVLDHGSILVYSNEAKVSSHSQLISAVNCFLDIWGPKASAPSTQQVPNFCQYDSNSKTEDIDSEHLLTRDSVSSDNVHNIVSCLHVSASVFHPKGVDPVVSNQFNDSVFSRSSVTWGFLSRPNREGHQFMVRHPLSFEWFQCSLADCPDLELVQFMLEGICDGVWLGSLEGTIDADPCHCKIGLCSSRMQSRAVSDDAGRGGQGLQIGSICLPAIC